jgi:dipeptidyl aminopeptidase/acylaminoacyl peptidase
MFRLNTMIVLVALLGSIQIRSQTGRLFVANDWASLRAAHSVGVSPDGSTLLYEVNHGGEQGPEQHEWWMCAPSGANRHKLDLPKSFSPSGFTREGNALYGTWEVGGQSQFAIFSLNQLNSQSAPVTVTLLPRGSRNPTPSPDGSIFALLFDPRAPDPLSRVRTVVEPPLTGIFVVRADGTHGVQWCKNQDRVKDISWSVDGKTIAVLSQTSKIGHHTVSSSLDLCNATGAVHALDQPAPITSIAWMADRQTLAFVSTSTHVLTPDHVWTVPVQGGVATDQTPTLQASALALTVDPHGDIWVSVQRGLHEEVDTLDGGKLTTVYRWKDGNVELPVFSPYRGVSPVLAFTIGDPRHPSNVAVAEEGQLSRITEEGRSELEQIDLGSVRAVHWTTKENVELDGVATFPPGYKEGEHRPFLVMPHGGPEANDTLAFDPLAQCFAAQGYVVLQPEYRGSTGYGSAFLEAIYQHRGDRAYRDVESATDFAIAQGWADPNRLAIFGWSAGGFMAAWTITQTSRYKAAVEGAGVTDWASFLWTSDIAQTIMTSAPLKKSRKSSASSRR